MIEPDNINHISVIPEATNQAWVGLFVGIPDKRDVRDAIEIDINRLQAGEVEDEQDEADEYLIALEVLMRSNFDDIDEDIIIAGVKVGTIKCERIGCFCVEDQTPKGRVHES